MAERKALEEAVQEATDGLEEGQKVGAAVAEAEAKSRRAEWAGALEKAEAALRYAHRAKAAMQIKVGGWRVLWCVVLRWYWGGK